MSKQLEMNHYLSVAQRSLECKRYALVCALCILPAGAQALHNDPSRVEAGDKVSISLPLMNDSASSGPFERARAEIVNIPAWALLTDSSQLGPVDLYPGEKYTFKVNFEIGASLPPLPMANDASIIIRLTQDAPDVLPSTWTWTFVSRDGFITFGGECQDEGGRICGGALAPDSIPPISSATFHGPLIIASGNHYISSSTYIELTSMDSAVENQERSGREFVQYVLDRAAPDFFSLTEPYVSTLSLTAGAHTLAFAAMDDNLNAESIHELQIFVDGSAPAAPLNLMANGASPSPWSNVGSYSIAWTNPQDDSGVRGAYYRLDSLPETPSASTSSLSLNLAGQLLNGSNNFSVRLEDNVGNQDPSNSATIALRYDDILPVSTVSALPLTSTKPVQVGLATSDPGADSLPQTGSGVGSVNLWVMRDTNDDGVFGPWTLSATISSTGSFSYDPGSQDGTLHFYTQAIDVAGNAEAAPGTATPPKAETFYDSTPPTLSHIRLPLISFAQAQVAWQSDDRTTGLVEYGPTPALGHSRATPLSRDHLAILDCSLFSPATIYYRITSTNRTGLTTVTALSSFVTPPQVIIPSDIFGVIDPSQPIDVQITNPDIMSATFTVDGQTGSIVFSTSTGFQIILDPSIGSGMQTLRIVLNGFVYETQFIVDTATRSVRLARAVLDAAGAMTDPTATPGSSVVEATLGEAAHEYMSGPGSRVYLGYYAAIDPLGPAVIPDLSAAAGPGAGQVSLGWTAVGDDASIGTAMKYDLRRSTTPIEDDADFVAASPVSLSTFPAVAGSPQASVVSGLADGTTYYFAVKAADEMLNLSPLGTSAMARTLEVVRSIELTNGWPTVEFLSFVPGVTITQVSTTTTASAVALATSAAAAQGLQFYTTIFDIVSPDPSLPGGATVQFRYTDPADPTLESNLRLYRFKPALNAWTLVADIGPNAAQDLFFLSVPGLSFYAVLYRDAVPPVTSLELRGGRQFVSAGGSVFASSTAVYGLVARDPSQGGSSGSGVTRTEYRVDSSNAPFTALPLTGLISLEYGTHTVQFRSVDNAGNVEPTRSAVIAVDAAAPVASLSVDAPSVATQGGLAVLSSTATLTVTLRDPLLAGGAPDNGSGVESVSYRLDGGSLAVASASFSLFLGTGTHLLSLLAQDRVGNLLDNTTSPFRVVIGDALPPRTTAEFGVPGIGGNQVYVTNATPIVLSSVDDLLDLGDASGLGVAFQEAALTSLSSGTTRSQRFSASVSTFLASAEADGLYALDFFAEDVAGNREDTRRTTVAVDNTPPLTALAPGTPSFAGSRLFVSTRTLMGFAAVDSVLDGAASGVDRTLYAVDGGSLAVFSSGFNLAGGTRAVSFQSYDRLGNAEIVRSTVVVVDADAPRTELSFLGAVAAASSQTVPVDADSFLSAAAAMALTAEETGSAETASGVALTRFRLDSGAFQVYGGTFAPASEGLHLLEFQSLDRVENEESLRVANVAVDTTPPSVELVVHGPAYPLGDRLFVSSSSVLEVSAADPVSGGVASGVGEVEFRVDPASGMPFALFTSSFTLPAGPYLVEFRGRDRVGNESAATARDVFVDTSAPISIIAAGEPKADLSGGVLLVSPLTPLLVVSTDPAAGGASSGIREVLVAVDSGAFTVSAGTFTLPGEGPRTVSYFARDNVLNAEEARTASLVVDGTPPVAALLSPSPSAVGVDQAFGRGLVSVVATVTDLHLSSHTLEFAAGAAAQGGFALIAAGTASVTRGELARWDTSALSGFYTLRLTAYDFLGAVSVSTAVAFVGDPNAVLVIKNQEGHGTNDKLLDKPEGVAVGADGSILVANTGKDQILKFGPQGDLLAVFDGATILVADKHGGDKGKGNDKKGETAESGASESITFKKPTGVAVDETSSVYVADRNNNRVVILSSAGVVMRSLGRTNPQGRFIPGTGAGEFNKPTGVAISPSRIAVADRNNGRVQVFDRGLYFLFDIKLDQGAPVPSVTSGSEEDDDEIGGPFAVAWGPDGALYVTDEGNDRVLVFDQQGALLASIGSEGDALGQFELPKGAAVSALSYLYAADRANKRVQKFDPFRTAVMAFGSSLDLQQPTGLALDSAGFLYLADRTADRVLKLGLPAPTTIVSVAPAAGSKTKKGKVSSNGGKLTRADRVTVEIPAGALAEELEISIEPERTSDPEEESRKKRAKEDMKLAAVSEGVEYGPEGTVFNAPVTLTLVYDPKALPAGAREEDLQVHYWNSGKSEWEAFPSTVDKELRTVSAKTLHFSLYQVMGSGTGVSIMPLAADPGFGLKAAYAFPNPVRGQSAVTIRVQPGLADSVEVRVYDISGRKVHQSSAFTNRGAFDDGNGLGAQFTYEHVWGVSGVGSGVYTYIVVARKAGQSDIRKTGRIGVVK